MRGLATYVVTGIRRLCFGSRKRKKTVYRLNVENKERGKS